MTVDPQFSKIVEQLNKVFASLKVEQPVEVSLILSQLDLSAVISDIEHKHATFSTDSLVKLHLYKRIKGIRTHEQLLRAIKESGKDANRLGFSEETGLPAKRTFNDFLKRKITVQTNQLLAAIVEKVLVSATTKGIVLDLELVKKTISQNPSRIKDDNSAFKGVTKLIKKLVYPMIKIKIGDNTTFTSRDLLDILVYVAYMHDFCNNGTATYEENNPGREVRTGDTILYHLKKLQDAEQVKDVFEKIFNLIFRYAKQNCPSLFRNRKVDIAFDTHKIPYYGNKHDPYVMGDKHERGTSNFFKFLTCSIVEGGVRFIIDAVPLHQLDNVDDMLNNMIKRAKAKIGVHHAYLDRGFDKPKVINMLKNHGIKFIMPKIRSDTVKAWFDKSEDCKARIIKDFQIGTGENKATASLVLVDDEDGVKRAFITNLDIPEQLAHHLYEWYRKRWGIETSYRNLAQDFRARTTSKNYLIRLFYFLFSTCLYNLWVLINICVGLSLYGKAPEKPIITAKRFAAVLYRVYVDVG